MTRLKAAILGATGVVGQQAIVALHGHPQFEVTALSASPQSAGMKYAAAITRSGTRAWYAGGEPPKEFSELELQPAGSLEPGDFDIVFSCLESDAARQIEPVFAEKTGVVSTSSAFRNESDVPLIIPSVNPEHSELIETQRRNRGWSGFIAPIPNCTTTGLAITLKPLDRDFGLRSVVMTSLQAVSGAGRSPGVAGLDVLDNVIPFISGEEDKVAFETQKILGKPMQISCTCMRVPVVDGHTETVSAGFERTPSPEEAAESLSNFSPPSATRSTPKRFVKVFSDPFRPQPRLDREEGGGMTVCVGRLREDPVLGLKYVLLSHNTKIGAAAGAVWLAELLAQKNFI